MSAAFVQYPVVNIQIVEIPILFPPPQFFRLIAALLQKASELKLCITQTSDQQEKHRLHARRRRRMKKIKRLTSRAVPEEVTSESFEVGRSGVSLVETTSGSTDGVVPSSSEPGNWSKLLSVIIFPNFFVW